MMKYEKSKAVKQKRVAGKIIGLIAGYLLIGQWWAILGGLFLGHLIDRHRRGIRSTVLGKKLNWSGVCIIADEPDVSFPLELVVSYCQALFMVLGRIAKLDGRVSKAEIAWVEQLMLKMNIGNELRDNCIELFRSGKELDRDIATAMSALYWQIYSYQNLKEHFVTTLMQAIYIDGTFNRPGWLLILEVATKMNFPEAKLWQLRHQYEDDRMEVSDTTVDLSRQARSEDKVKRKTATPNDARDTRHSESAYHFKRRATSNKHSRTGYSDSNGDQRFHRWERDGRSWNRKGRRAHSVASSQSTGEKEAVATLGMTDAQWQKCDKKQLKKVYRTLMSAHHPDKLIATGASAKKIEAAKARTQSIRAAYERLMLRL